MSQHDKGIRELTKLACLCLCDHGNQPGVKNLDTYEDVALQLSSTNINRLRYRDHCLPQHKTLIHIAAQPWTHINTQ